MVGHRGIACVWVVLSLLVGPGVVFSAPATAKKAKHAVDLARVPGKGPDLLVFFPNEPWDDSLSIESSACTQNRGKFRRTRHWNA